MLPDTELHGKPPQIRNLLMQRGMIILYFFIVIGWCAMAALGTGGLLGQTVERSEFNLTPDPVEIRETTEATVVPSGLFGTLIATTPESNTDPLTPEQTATRRNNGIFSDLLRGTREP